MNTPQGHRGFAACWDFATKHESNAEREMRREACARTHGRVLELGVGVGANWPFLSGEIEYVGIEPDPYMLQRAQKRATAAGEHRALKGASAEQLPFEDESFDSVLVTYTLCTVQDPPRALAETLRVLKPGGTLAFVEHVRPEGRFGGWFMDRISPLWGRTAGGCHPNRQTVDALSAAGFEIDHLEQRRVNGMPMISGTAHKGVS